MQRAAACEQRRGGVLTLFFRPFLTTPEGMDADLGFRVTPQEHVGSVRREPQIAAHVEAPCQVHHEKGSEKDPQAPS